MSDPQVSGQGEVVEYNKKNLSQITEKTTVFIKRDLERPKLFRCNNCGSPLFQYQGSVVMLVPGDANDGEQRVVNFPIIIKCKHGSDEWGQCRATYIIEGWAV